MLANWTLDGPLALGHEPGGVVTAVGIHGTELSNAKVGESAVILGAGCIGLCTLLALKARGVSEIYVADVMDARLAKAKELGATRVYRNLWPKAIAAVSSGMIPVRKIVSHEFDFKDCIEAIDFSLNHKDEVIKAVIKFTD